MSIKKKLVCFFTVSVVLGITIAWTTNVHAEDRCASGTWISTGGNGTAAVAKITINGNGCTAEQVSLCSYSVYVEPNTPGWLTTQTLFDSKTVTVRCGESAIVSVKTDNCRGQVNAYAGPCVNPAIGDYASLPKIFMQTATPDSNLCGGSKCTDECSGTQRVCDGNGWKQCNKGADGCYHWSAKTSCVANETCNNGSCITSCNNECSKDGEHVCDGNAWKQCNKGADGCYHWSGKTNCEFGKTCSNGSCILKCENECVFAEHRCTGSSLWVCGKNFNSCTSWAKYKECDAECFHCGDDRCECGETKSSCPQDCGSVNICSDTLSGSPSSEEQQKCTAAGGQIQCGNGWCKCNCAQKPTVNINSSGSVSCNKKATLNWTSTNTTSCTASGDWSGSKPTSGSESVGDFTGKRSFTITCTGNGGSSSDTESLTGTNEDIKANAGSDKDIDQDDSVTLNGSVEGDYDSVRWSCTGGTLSNRTSLRPTFKADSDDDYDSERTYTCTLTVSGECGSDSDSMKVTVSRNEKSNFNISLTTRPNSVCAPAKDIDLVANVTNYGNNSHSYTYSFDCENDSNWDKTVTTDNTSYTATDLCDYRNIGSYTAKVKVTSDGRTATDTDVVRVNDCENHEEAGGQVSITKTVRNVTGGTGYQGTVIANPGDTVSYKIVVFVNSGDINNVMVGDAVPTGIINVGNYQIDGLNMTGVNPANGISLGRMSSGQTKIITYDAKVAGENNFGYGQTTMTNTATVSADGESANSSAAVQVYRHAVQGATTVSTGFNSNMLAGIGIAIAGAAISFGLMFRYILRKKKMTAEELLARKISSIKKNSLA